MNSGIWRAFGKFFAPFQNVRAFPFVLFGGWLAMNAQQVPYYQQPLPGPGRILAAHHGMPNSPAASIYDVFIQKCSCLPVIAGESILVELLGRCNVYRTIDFLKSPSSC